MDSAIIPVPHVALDSSALDPRTGDSEVANDQYWSAVGALVSGVGVTMHTTDRTRPTLRTAQRCMHDFLHDQCAECRPVPPGLTATVFVTSSGQVFHRTPDCQALLDGQAKARSYGHTTRDATRRPLNQARSRDLSPCMICFASAYQR